MRVLTDFPAALRVLLRSQYTNIDGKAPAGYGLGTSSIQVGNPNAINKNGWYMIDSGTPAVDGTIWYGYHEQYSDDYAFQSFIRADYDQRIERKKIGGVWQPWEWANPPMVPGVEYRTTERRNGNVVYTKLVEIGALPNNTSKTVSVGVSAIEVFRTEVSAFNYNADAHSVLPYTNTSGEICGYIIWGTDISITSNSNFTAYSAYVQIWYIK